MNHKLSVFIFAVGLSVTALTTYAVPIDWCYVDDLTRPICANTVRAIDRYRSGVMHEAHYCPSLVDPVRIARCQANYQYMADHAADHVPRDPEYKKKKVVCD